MGGGLLVNAKQQRLEESLKENPLTKSEDGFLHFGSKVMLVNHQSEDYLAGNAHEKILKAAGAYAITTSPNSNGCVRNVYTIEQADTNDGFEDDVVTATD